MSVMLETSLGEVVVDLWCESAPLASKNFLKLCKIKYYNGVLFYNVQQNLLAQTGDPTGTGRGGTSVYVGRAGSVLWVSTLGHYAKYHRAMRRARPRSKA